MPSLSLVAHHPQRLLPVSSLPLALAPSPGLPALPTCPRLPPHPGGHPVLSFLVKAALTQAGVKLAPNSILVQAW